MKSINKVLYRDRSPEAAYEKDGVIYSAYQRREIVERIEYEDGTVEIKVIGHWKRGKQARDACDAYNEANWGGMIE